MSLEFPMRSSQVSVAKVFKERASDQQHRWYTGAANAGSPAPSGLELQRGVPRSLCLRKPTGDAGAK